MKTMKHVLIAMVGLSIVAAAPVAMAQDDPRDKIIASVEFQDGDIRDVLRFIFTKVGVSYTVANDVQGSVTISLKDKPFETILQAVLKQVDATYRVEGNIYNIIKKEAVVINPENNSGSGTLPTTNQTRLFPIRIDHADPMVVYQLLTGRFGFDSYPEMSTAIGVGSGGGGFGGGGFGGGGFGGGGFGGGGFGGGGRGGGFGGGGFGGGRGGGGRGGGIGN